MKINIYNLYQIIDSIKDSLVGQKWVDLCDSVGFKDVYDDKGLPDIGKLNGQRPSKKEYLRKRLSELNGKSELRVFFERFLNSNTQYKDVIAKNIKDDGYQISEIEDSLTIIGGVTTKPKPVKTEAYFDNIANQVINDLDKARVSIHVAMAWFTNQKIANKLIEKYKEGLDVKVVGYKDHTNVKFGVDLDGIPHKLINGTRGGKMHHKFCVIDNQKVITGSYNWSENAENKNDENAAVIYDDDRASDYSVTFRDLFR
jgi:phosphatidylserine/phosphatidylglycerophosphate/cardiolipin synthase-like enzyme